MTCLFQCGKLCWHWLLWEKHSTCWGTYSCWRWWDETSNLALFCSSQGDFFLTFRWKIFVTLAVILRFMSKDSWVNEFWISKQSLRRRNISLIRNSDHSLKLIHHSCNVRLMKRHLWAECRLMQASPKNDWKHNRNKTMGSLLEKDHWTST